MALPRVLRYVGSRPTGSLVKESIMGDLVTAWDKMAFGDYGHADQEGKTVDPDTVYFYVKEPPWITTSGVSEGTLEGLEPPKKLRREWFNELLETSHLEAWKEVNYEERYKDYLRRSSKAQEDMFRVSTLSKHHQVCLICQEELYHFCIRRLVYEFMRDNGDINP